MALFALRLGARIPFLFVAGRLYGATTVGRFALAVVASTARILGQPRDAGHARASAVPCANVRRGRAPMRKRTPGHIGRTRGDIAAPGPGVEYAGAANRLRRPPNPIEPRTSA